MAILALWIAGAFCLPSCEGQPRTQETVHPASQAFPLLQSLRTLSSLRQSKRKPQVRSVQSWRARGQVVHCTKALARWATAEIQPLLPPPSPVLPWRGAASAQKGPKGTSAQS